MHRRLASSPARAARDARPPAINGIRATRPGIVTLAERWTVTLADPIALCGTARGGDEVEEVEDPPMARTAARGRAGNCRRADPVTAKFARTLARGAAPAPANPCQPGSIRSG
jgi:hypothetical protein